MALWLLRPEEDGLFCLVSNAVEESKYLGFLFQSEGKMKWVNHRWSSVTSALMKTQPIVVKKEQSSQFGSHSMYK